MPEVASAPPIAPATVASATAAAMAPKRRLPDDPELGSAFDDAASSPCQARSPGDMIINLPGIRGASGSAVPGLAGSTLNGSAFGMLILGKSGFGASWSGAMVGDSTPISGAEAITGVSFASTELKASGAALRAPVSVLLCSACCSLTCKSPVKVDHLVTFIACEIVTGGRLTEILGTLRGRFRPRRGAGAAPARGPVHAALRYLIPLAAEASFARPYFPTNMTK